MKHFLELLSYVVYIFKCCRNKVLVHWFPLKEETFRQYTTSLGFCWVVVSRRPVLINTFKYTNVGLFRTEKSISAFPMSDFQKTRKMESALQDVCVSMSSRLSQTLPQSLADPPPFCGASIKRQLADRQTLSTLVGQSDRQTDGQTSLLSQQQSGELQISWYTQLPAWFHLQTWFPSMSSCSLKSEHRKFAWLPQLVWS